MRSKRFRFASMVAFVLAAAIAATPVTTAVAKDKVTLRLGWIMKGEYAFFFTGKEKGIFDKHNIDVDIREGKGSVAAMQSVANKYDTFGYSGGAPYLLSRSKGMPIKMVAVMLQKGPQVLLSWPDKPVRAPKDLEGKSIILTPGDGFHALWPAFLAGNNIDRGKVKEVNLGVDVRGRAFLQRQADVSPEYVTSAVLPLEEKAGVEFVKLYLADLGWDTINNGIFVHEDTIKENPDLVKRFVAAALEAFAYTAKNLEEATEIMQPKLGGQSRTVVRKQIEATAALAHTQRTAGKPLGWSHPDDWKDSLDLIIKGGHVKPNEIREVEYYFTNDFIPNK